MNIFSDLLLQAAARPKGMGDPLILTIVMVGFIGIFYLFIVRPQNKKRKEMEKMLNAIKKGDRVVSIGGIHGKVASVKDNEIVVRIDSNAEITFEKSAISRVLKSSAAPQKDDSGKIEDKTEDKKGQK